MTDEKPPEEPAVEEPQQDPTEKPAKPDDLINKAIGAAERMEKANTEMSKLLDRQERLKVEETLGGTADAGSAKPKKDENAEAKKMLEGTGFEDMFDEPAKK